MDLFETVNSSFDSRREFLNLLGRVLKKLQIYPKQTVVTVTEIRQAIIDGENEDAVTMAKKLIKSGFKPEDIIVHGVTKAMEDLDKKCTIRDFCLLELMLAGRAAMDVIDCLYEEGTPSDDKLFDTGPYPGKKIILGTIKGDIHEIGRKIFSMIMRSYGYQIIDMGKDVEPADLVTAAIDHQADFIGISSLITTTIPHVREVRKLTVDKGLGAVKIIAGGAALQQSSADFLNVDHVAETAFDGLHYIKSF